VMRARDGFGGARKGLRFREFGGWRLVVVFRKKDEAGNTVLWPVTLGSGKRQLVHIEVFIRFSARSCKDGG